MSSNVISFSFDDTAEDSVDEVAGPPPPSLIENRPGLSAPAALQRNDVPTTRASNPSPPSSSSFSNNLSAPSEDRGASKKGAAASDSKLWKRVSGGILPWKKEEKPVSKKVDRAAIGTPTNFVHVQTIKKDGPPAVATLSSAPYVSPAVAAAMAEAAAAASESATSSAPDGVSGSSGPAMMRPLQRAVSSDRASDESSDSVASEMATTALLNTKDIEDLLGGSYFLRHTEKETQQRYVCCSDDLRSLVMWNTFHDKADKKAPKESFSTTEILDVRSGYQTSVFEKTGIAGRDYLAFSIVMANSRTIDLEAFTEEERALWLARFHTLIGFLKQKL